MPKTQEEKDINTLIDELVKKERDQENVHRWSSIRPSWKISKYEYEKILDSLARLFVGDEKCVAIYVNTNEENKWMVIASNIHKPTNAKEWMELLSEYAKNPSKDNYFKLLEKAMNNIYKVFKKEEDRDNNLLWEETVKWLNYKKYLHDISRGQRSKPSTNIEWEALINLAKAAFEETKEKKCCTSREKYLLPLLDAHYIANYLAGYSNSLRNREEIWGRRKDLFDLIQRNDKEEIFYWNNQKDGGQRREKKDLHAEMKVLTMIYEYRRSENDEEGHFDKEKDWGYVGISKLCCLPCQQIIDIVNEENPVVNIFERIGGKRRTIEVKKRFTACGTHGGTYPNWVVPEFYQKELIKKLNALVIRKLCETTEEKVEQFPQILQTPY